MRKSNQAPPSAGGPGAPPGEGLDKSKESAQTIRGELSELLRNLAFVAVALWGYGWVAIRYGVLGPPSYSLLG